MTSLYESELLGPPMISDSVTPSCGFAGLTRTSSLRNGIRKREPIWILNIRQQLLEQLRLLDSRLDSHVTLLNELQDFYKKRSEVEAEYSRGLDKVIKQIMTRHKTEKLKRESWPGFSTYSLWQTLLGTTRKVGRDHSVLGDLYTSQIISKLTELSEDVQRIYKKCREMAAGCHDELLRVMGELQSAMKTYHMYHNDFLQAESKLSAAENQLQKLEGVATNKIGLSRKLKNFAKHTDKKRHKYAECRVKAVKARNEYILCIESANAAVQRYFNDDLQELINTMDYGYHLALSQVVMIHISAEENLVHSLQGCLVLLNQRSRGLDQRLDKQVFLDTYSQFSAPQQFEFQPYRGDTINHLTAEKSLQEDLLDRLNAINDRLNNLQVENDEIWKTLETTDGSLMTLITQDDLDVTYLFQAEGQPIPGASGAPGEKEKRRTDRLETEEFYLGKFRQFQSSKNIMGRLQAKHDCIETALSLSNCAIPESNRSSSLAVPRKKRDMLSNSPRVGQARLFGGTIEDYVLATGEDIPLVVRSCIRAINLYGMHHQGVFRISGSQHEINEYKSQFERGKDPIPDKVDGKDINSIAGVLKLYFRELREPLFPRSLFDQLVSFCNNCNYTEERIPLSVVHIRDMLLSNTPRSVLIVMRFLFAFLNHLSEFSDENMMDPYNLAICFGPTLLPVPSDHDLVMYQGHVNELMRTIIIHQEEIFVYEGGSTYERCIADVSGRRDDSLDNLSDEEDMAVDAASEEDVFYDQDLVREGVALYDFTGRTNRELSFRKGERLMLYEKVSGDWWEGSVDEREGLIPDKYIQLKSGSNASENRMSTGDAKSSESLPSRSSSKITKSPRPSDTSSMTASTNRSSIVASDRPLSQSVSPGTVKRPAPIPRRSTSPMPHPRSSLPAQMSPGGSSSASSCYTDEDTNARSLPSCSPISGRRASADELDSALDGGEFVKKVRPPMFKVREKRDSLLETKEKTSKSDPNQLASSSVDQSNMSSIEYVMNIKKEGLPRARKNEKESAYVSEDSVEDPDANKTAEDLQLDIDTALAEVMSGIQSLGAAQGRCQDDIRRELEIKCTEINDKDIFDVQIVTMPPREQEKRAAAPSEPPLLSKSKQGVSTKAWSGQDKNTDDYKRTPDLVIDLPLNSTQPPSPPVKIPSSPGSAVTSPGDTGGRHLTTAEMFAKADQCTIKKGTSVSGTSGASDSLVTATASTHSSARPNAQMISRVTNNNENRSTAEFARNGDGINRGVNATGSGSVAARLVSGRISPNYDNLPLIDDESVDPSYRLDRTASEEGYRFKSSSSSGRRSDSGVSSGPPSAADDSVLSFSPNQSSSPGAQIPANMSKSFTLGDSGTPGRSVQERYMQSVEQSRVRNPVQKSYTLSASDRGNRSVMKTTADKPSASSLARSSTLERGSTTSGVNSRLQTQTLYNESFVSGNIPLLAPTPQTRTAGSDKVEAVGAQISEGRGRGPLADRSVSVVEHCVSSVVTKTNIGSLPRTQSAGAADRPETEGRGGVKPPVKSKPPIMKKPSRSGEGLSPVRTNDTNTAEISSVK